MKKKFSAILTGVFLYRLKNRYQNKTTTLVLV